VIRARETRVQNKGAEQGCRDKGAETRVQRQGCRDRAETGTKRVGEYHLIH
jgi:hypothetical protein